MTDLEKLKIVSHYFPNAQMELHYNTNFQMIIAVLLSAQTTDKVVNRATNEMFSKYSEAKDFKNLSFEYIYDNIKIVGFAKTKANNILKTAKIVDEKYNGEIVNDKQKLLELPGVGTKTANVVLANIYGAQYMAVDTHVLRISQRLGIVELKVTIEEVEKKLEKILINENINEYHHKIIFFGRYHCTAKKPKCEKCKLTKECTHYNQKKEK